MIPDFQIFGKTFTAYMICAIVGALFTLWFTYFQAKRHGIDEIDTLYMLLFGFLGVVLGGHIMYGITNFNMLVDFIKNIGSISSFSEFINGVAAIFGGSVYYGGLIGALLAGYLFVHHRKLSVADFGDMGALAIPLFHTFGRIGCFLSGCCYGIPFKWGVYYRYSQVAQANFVTRFPVQAVEAVLNLALFLVLYRLFSKRKAHGLLLPAYLVTYPIYRFLLEFLRGDDYRGFLATLSTSQILSIVVFIFGAIWMAGAIAVSKRNANTNPERA